MILDDLLDYANVEQNIADNLFIALNVTFMKDFGPWTRGIKAVSIGFNYYEGKLIEYNNDGDIIRSHKVHLSDGEKIV